MANTYHIETDLWADIQSAEERNDYEKLKGYFDLINAEELNKFTTTDPNHILLHALIKFFDLGGKYPRLLNNLFELSNVDPRDVNINFQNPVSGSTALMLAADRGHFRLVQTLLFWKADPHIRSFNQKTAFVCAINNTNVEIAQFLSIYLTREELELEVVYTGQTPREEVEDKLMRDPTEQKYQDLFKIITDIEVRHLVEDRIEEEALIDAEE